MKITNSKAVLESLKLQLAQKLRSHIPALTNLSKELVNQSYTSEFARNPVDTGQAKNDTKAYVEYSERNKKGDNEPTLTCVFEIKGEAENYAIFFLEPNQMSNPNFKYGRRNTIKRARDNLQKKLLN